MSMQDFWAGQLDRLAQFIETGDVVEKTITMFYKNGTSCTHSWDQSEESWEKLVLDIGGQMAKPPKGGILRLQGPYGFHDIGDITHFHISDFGPPATSHPIGFV